MVATDTNTGDKKLTHSLSFFAFFFVFTNKLALSFSWHRRRTVESSSAVSQSRVPTLPSQEGNSLPDSLVAMFAATLNNSEKNVEVRWSCQFPLSPSLVLVIHFFTLVAWR